MFATSITRRKATFKDTILIKSIIIIILTECLAEARELRDMSRRIDIYQIAFGEPVVSDHKIAEQWYSLGKYRLAGTASNLTTRSCGSTYPVGLSGITF